jgi:secondary thiamine-phosphate synthase enzyme
MKYELEIQSNVQTGFIDITQQVQDCVRKSGVQDGICVVFVPHTTASPICNENWDPGLQVDTLMILDRVAPSRLSGALAAHYRHSDGNAAAHIKASLLGASQTLLVENGKLVLGTWQGVYLAEFDGPRHRRVLVRIIRDAE